MARSPSVTLLHLASTSEIGFELQELLEAFEHQWMVVNQDQANWCIATRPVPAAA